MRDHYGILSKTFWDGSTGRAIMREGGGAAQLVGAYLMSSPRATMLGLFHHPFVDFADYLAVEEADLVHALVTLGRRGFAHFDTRTEYVWVVPMARFRCGCKDWDTPLKPEDNRVKAANRLYSRMPPNPFLGQFYGKYHVLLSLEARRRDDGKAKPLIGGNQGPSKALTSTGTRYQVPGTATTPVGTARPKPRAKQKRKPRLDGQVVPGAEAKSFRIISAVVRAMLEESEWADQESLVELSEEAKARCASHQIAYDSTTIARAIDSEQAKRGMTLPRRPLPLFGEAEEAAK